MSTTCSASDPTSTSPELLELTGDEAWHLAVVERGAAARRIGRAPRRWCATTSRICSARWRPSGARDRLHNPALHADRVDSILATCCAVLAIMRRLQFGTAAAIRPASAVH